MRGLYNLGNTCYLNFILQILFNTKRFREVFSQYAARINEHERMSHPLYTATSSFHRLMECYHNDTSPEHLRKALHHFVNIFSRCHNQLGYGQQDGHEYLMFLMRAIHDSMYSERHLIIVGQASNYAEQLEKQSIESHRVDGSSTSELMLKRSEDGEAAEAQICYDSVIFQLFSGQYRFQTQCREPGCEHVSNRFETFRCCEAPIGNPDKQSVTLADVLTEYTSVTELDDPYECDKCKVRSKCYRRCTFWRLPEILIISLKRGVHHFDQQSGRYLELKDNRQVKIPEKLDLAEYCSAPRGMTTYELYATGNHLGLTNGGHYYAQIKDPEDGKWKVANDNKISEEQGPLEHICLLFYRTVST